MASLSPARQGSGRLRWAGHTASTLPLQTGEYATDEDEELSPTFPGGEMAIEVFELAENEDALSPVDMEPEKLVHKFKEVGRGRPWGGGGQRQALTQPEPSACLSAPIAPDQARCD